MSQIDQFLDYLSTLNESTIQLTKQDYQKICAIRDKVTELAAKVPLASNLEKPKPVQIKETAKPKTYQAVNESSVMLFEEFITEKIVKSGNKWLVKDSKGKKTLGTHPTREKAIAQLRAIEISKAGR